ncbi:MAG: universal stress protein [Dehalococcoidia bacterium]|nr:universal stress protein [Dehalococcoidia bacterium]MDW8119162.1 universal stress protein [Chloroflexota bacterium]
MGAYKRIIVPLDGSPLAEEVLPHAETLASLCQAEVALVQVVPLVNQVLNMGLAGGPDVGPYPPAHIEALTKAMEAEVERAKAYLEHTAERLRRKGLRVSTQVRRGDAGEEIVAAAREGQADLIAISTHGRSGLSRLVFGSVAETVIRQAGVPVLVIKPAGKKR